MIAEDDLVSFLGKANCVAGLMHVWRPFLGMAWGALYDRKKRGSAPRNCVWKTQVEIPLLWCVAFLRNESDEMIRHYTIEAYTRRGDRVLITTDASPWAIGAFLVIGGVVKRFFYQAVQDEDLAVLKVKRGDHRAQQAFESLALLVALREWEDVWKGLRVAMTVRSDSVAGLTAMLKFKSAGDAPAIVAREAALLIGRSTYTPIIFQHIPGIANCIADVLSRLDSPGGEQRKLPEELKDAERHHPQTRARAWWRSLALP